MRLVIAMALMAASTGAYAMTHQQCVNTLADAYSERENAYRAANEAVKKLDRDKAPEAFAAAVKLRDDAALLHRDYIKALADYCETLR